MLSVDEALELVLARVTPRPPGPCALSDALGRVLAEEVTSDVDSPPHDKSLVDGYAIVAEDLAEGRAEFDVVEEVTAGAVPSQAIERGQATRIMTGAPIPPGASAVVMVEYSEPVVPDSLPQRVRLVARPASEGQNIMRRASSMRQGQVVLSAGRVLRGIELGVLAEVGRTRVQAVPPPTLAVLATGNELVSADAIPQAGQIRNSNGPLLMAAARMAGAAPLDLGIARDDATALREKIDRGLECDVLVISGGVSAGVLDLVPGALAAAGVQQVFHKVNLKPGKPLWFGTSTRSIGQTLVFGLPGNPVSSPVCFELFVRPALAMLSGRGPAGLDELSAILAVDYQHRGERPTYHPARLTQDREGPTVAPLRWQGSGDLRTLVEANALACFPSGTVLHRAGERVRTLKLP
jgi:molybdopterin molybdotransferase